MFVYFHMGAEPGLRQRHRVEIVETEKGKRIKAQVNLQRDDLKAVCIAAKVGALVGTFRIGMGCDTDQVNIHLLDQELTFA